MYFVRENSSHVSKTNPCIIHEMIRWLCGAARTTLSACTAREHTHAYMQHIWYARLWFVHFFVHIYLLPAITSSCSAAAVCFFTVQLRTFFPILLKNIPLYVTRCFFFTLINSNLRKYKNYSKVWIRLEIIRLVRVRSNEKNVNHVQKKSGWR